jgi:transposase-like protein
MDGAADNGLPLSALACPNPDCRDFNHFGAGNLSVAELTGKHKAIRRLYCHTCGHRFSERQGSLLQYTKLPLDTVVRIVKCLGHGCSLDATADICDVDARSVARLLEKAGLRAADFHRQQLERLRVPLQAVELDELHARASDGKKGAKRRAPVEGPTLLQRVAQWVESGFMRLWL